MDAKISLYDVDSFVPKGIAMALGPISSTSEDKLMKKHCFSSLLPFPVVSNILAHADKLGWGTAWVGPTLKRVRSVSQCFKMDKQVGKVLEFELLYLRHEKAL